MANITIPDEIKEKLAKLPKKVQDILINTETAATIGRIGLTHKLKIDKIGVLADETTLVILGGTPAKDFTNNLKKRLEIDYEDAAKIAVDINEQIFAEIREELGGEGSGIKEGTAQQITDKKQLTIDNKPGVMPQIPVTQQPTTGGKQLATIAPVAVPMVQVDPRTPLGSPKGESLGGEVATPLVIQLTPFEQKLKEDAVFSAPAVVSTHEAPQATQLTTDDKQPTTTATAKPPLPTKAEIKYGGQDPYKEPLE